MLFGKLVGVLLRESIHGNELMGMAIPTFEHPEGALRRYGLRQGLLSASSIVLRCATSYSNSIFRIRRDTSLPCSIVEILLSSYFDCSIKLHVIIGLFWFN